jgi:cell division protein FtsW (lipid II flippase)
MLSVAGGLVLLGGAILSSPFRVERLLAHFSRVVTDPYGVGFEARMLALASEQAGWSGFQGDLSATAMARLPASMEWYSLSYLGLSLGHAVVLLAIVLLFVLVFLVYRLSRKVVDDTLRLVVQGGGVILTLDLLWGLAGGLAWIVPNGHYGVPFLSAGQMSLVAVLLLMAVSGQGRGAGK